MKTLDIHIGEIVSNRIKEIGMTKAEFGRRMNTSRQNVNTLLRKKDWIGCQLIEASLILKANFFQPYLNFLGPEIGAIPPKSSEAHHNLSISLSLEKPSEMTALLERLDELREG